MDYSKEQLLKWLRNLNRNQFEEIIKIKLGAGEQVHLTRPIDVIDLSTFLNDAEQMQKLEEVSKYLEGNFLRQRPPELAPLQEITLQDSLPFKDREEQISKILLHATGPYLILDAPLGYGKTELLKRLEIEYKDTGWNALYIELNGNETKDQVCEKMLASIPSPVKLRSNIPVELTTSSEICLKAQNRPGSGVVLLIDIANQPTADMLSYLANILLGTIHRVVTDGIREYQSISHPFRVILAGRYSTAWQSKITFSLPFDWLALPMFNFTIIRNVTYSFLTKAVFANLDQIAAHIFYLTGGHPGLIANILIDYKNLPIPADTYLDTRNVEIWSNWIAPYVNTIYDELLASFPDLSQVLDMITIFRFMDDPCMQEIVEKDTSKIFLDCYNLQDVLIQTNIFMRDGRIIKDCLVRRLLAIRLWRTNPDLFCELCTQAQAFCLVNIASTLSPKEVWAVEYLFQFLHKRAPHILNRNSRDQLRVEFFDAAVPTILKAFLERVGITEKQRKGEVKALKDRIVNDWEFQYTVNYYLRQDQYDNSPFEKLVEMIK